MSKDNKITKPYSEVIFEIELFGHFNPDTFSLLWLQKNKLLGSKESEEINEKFFLQGQGRAFSTPFIDIRISKESFEIAIIDLKSIDLQLDFTLGILEKINSSLSDRFNINLKFHFSNNKENQAKALNSTIDHEKWSNILSNPQNIGLRVEEQSKFSTYRVDKTISISKCYRKDLDSAVHLNIFNEILIDKKNEEIYTILTHEFVSEILNSSIEKTNAIIKTFF